MDNMNPLSHWQQNEAVKGVYFGHPFTGTLTDATRPTPDYKNMIFVVWLDAPLTIYGKVRQVIEVWTHSNDVIAKAKGE